jgi:hypothetical protein
MVRLRLLEIFANFGLIILNTHIETYETTAVLVTEVMFAEGMVR